jgi:predicted transcriptional regulator
VAIFSWISNITRYSGHEISIKKPADNNINILNNLNNDWLILLQQFIYHKYLNTERIKRILNIDEQNADNTLVNLKRCGLISEVQNGNYQINPFIHNAISNKLIELRIL